MGQGHGIMGQGYSRVKYMGKVHGQGHVARVAYGTSLWEKCMGKGH